VSFDISEVPALMECVRLLLKFYFRIVFIFIFTSRRSEFIL
jgi:hypothetical protein